MKLAVTGCPRNCAEALCKDLGVVAVDGGRWEMYVGGAARAVLPREMQIAEVGARLGAGGVEQSFHARRSHDLRAGTHKDTVAAGRDHVLTNDAGHMACHLQGNLGAHHSVAW